MSFEGVSIGDIHLDKLRSLFPQEHIQLQMREVYKITDWALSQGIEHVFLLGDLGEFDTLSEEAKEALLEYFHHYDGRLSIYVIFGNHDYREKGVHSLKIFARMSRMGMFSSIHVFEEPQAMTIDGVLFNFLPYPHSRSISDEPSVNVAHIERKGAIRDNGVKVTKGLEEPEDEDTWIIGHLHRQQRLKDTFFPGTLFQTNFGEPLPKGWSHFKFKMSSEGKLKRKIEWYENDPGFVLENKVVQTESDLDSLVYDPYTLYKLHVHTGIKLPTNLSTDYPNINKIVGFKDEKDLESLAVLPQAEGGEGVEFGLTDNLGPYLKENKSATNEQVHRAEQLVEKAFGGISSEEVSTADS